MYNNTPQAELDYNVTIKIKTKRSPRHSLSLTCSYFTKLKCWSLHCRIVLPTTIFTSVGEKTVLNRHILIYPISYPHIIKLYLLKLERNCSKQTSQSARQTLPITKWLFQHMRLLGVSSYIYFSWRETVLNPLFIMEGRWKCLLATGTGGQ